MKIAERIKAELEKDGNTYEVRDVVKAENNGKELHGFSIAKNGSGIGCNVYYDSDVIEEDEIVTDVTERYKNAGEVPFDEDYIHEILRDKNYILANVFPSVVNHEKNEKAFDKYDIVHDKFLDMDVIYRVVVKEEDDGISSTKITNGMLAISGVSIEEIREAAFKNIKEKFVVKSMFETIMEMQGISTDELPPIEENEPRMYVVTTKNKTCGAGILASDEIMNEVRNRIGADELWVLPSSIHELIVIPKTDDGQFDAEALRDMVSGVNDEMVREEEILSYNVYVNSQKGTEVA